MNSGNALQNSAAFEILNILADGRLLLCQGDGGLFLQIVSQDKAIRSPGPVFVDFTNEKLLYRINNGSIRREAIARAMGLKGGETLTVLDATGGFGRDAFILATLGCCVTIIERAKVVTALLKDGLRRAEQNPDLIKVVKRIRCKETDSVTYMQQLLTDKRPDVVYLDPMFPLRKKTARVKKEMIALQLLLAGEEDNTAALLHIARQTARKRVVVKRPRLAPFLDEQAPDFSQQGRSCRFDIHLC